MTTTRDYLDTLPALPDTVLTVLAREVTATDYHRAAQGGGYDVATLVEVAGRIVARELHAAPGEVERLRAIEAAARHLLRYPREDTTPRAALRAALDAPAAGR